MVIIVDDLVSKIIEKVIDVGFDYLADRYARHTGMKDELQRLQVALPHIQAVVKAAENTWAFQQQNVANRDLQDWLQQLKDAIYEADDALDELDYLRLQKQVEADDDRDGGHHKVRHLFSHSKQNVIKFGKRCFKSDPILKNLRRAVKSLGEVAAHVGDFQALSNEQQSQFQQHQSQVIRTRETGPLLTESIVFGRDEEKKELLQWLMKDQPDEDEMNNVSLYSVVGQGGMGKTTLAQLVYNDEDVKNSFDLRMWVCVSTNSDVRQITADMLESATKKKPECSNLATLQDALENKLMTVNKKFLLVLDDVWNVDNWSEWDKLLAPLRHGHKGSKILLTTREDKVAKVAAQAMGGSTKEYLQLKPIHRDDFFSLFDRYAFAGKRSGDYTQLRCIGRQIAKRLGGLPLAAKTIGALLNSNLNERHWTNILDCKNIAEQGGDIKSILMLSYHHLPFYLRPCFAFCSTFPQDYEFDKEDLVFKWMALGFIQHSPQNQGQAPEDIGSCYFDELLSRSFFEKEQWGSSYTMHDLLHDVARSVSNGECFSIVNDDKSVEDIPNTVRHTVRHLYLELDINNLNTIMKVDIWQQLRSLHLDITGDYELHEITQVLEKVFKSLKNVRMLEVNTCDTSVLPDVFGHLRHLRNLTITDSYLDEFDEFPASLCKLYNLQVLKFYVKGSTALPENMKNLINLRHLVTCSRSSETINFLAIARVRKLSSLQRLDISIKKERDYKIDELEGLNMIRELHLQGLENVESPLEASMAKLGDKKHLRVLSLEWSHQDNDTERNNPNMDEQQHQIFDCLQPHSNLKELRIKRYKGVRPANWMDFELVNNLQRMTLLDCSRLEHLPSFGKLPFLKYLSLKNMPLVKQLDCDFQPLEELSLENMEGLEVLSHSDANSGQWCPSLLKLRIVNSPELSVLPSLSLSLKSMNLVDVGLTALPKLWLGGEGSSSSSLSSLIVQERGINLQRIALSGCSRLEHLPSFGKLPFLEYLSLEDMPLVKQLECDCQRLEELSLDNMEGLEEVLSHSDANSGQWCPSLRQLTIENSPELSVLPSLSLGLQDMKFKDVGLTVLPKLWLGSEGSSSSSSSSSLSKLTIWSCRKLTSLDEGLLQQQHYLTALRYLEIWDCDMLVDFPAGGLQHLQALRHLEINCCPKLRLDPTVIDPAGNDDNFLPSSLQRLDISHCAELEMSIPTLLLKGTLSSLSRLLLGGMKYLPPSSVWRKLASLDSLSISDCEELMSLEAINALQHLRTLCIRSCPKLVCTASTPVRTGLTLYLNIDDPMLLLSESFRNLTSLRELTITNCREVESISGRMEEWLLQSRTTLNRLILWNASSLESLPDSLQTFASLVRLELTGAGNLQSLPRLPSSLEYLHIFGCNETLKERCRKDEGADWPNIKHIPNRII